MKKSLLILCFVLFAGLMSQAQIIVNGEITSNTTWTNNNIYILDGWVYVRDGATLTIQPGTLIKGDFESKGALIIERGAQLIADGTAEQPIVFTSQKAAGINPETQTPYRGYGDWGGIIICGRASVNVPANAGNGTAAGEAIIEGGVGSIYGGGATPNDDDNSGILRYVRIEYCGIAFQPNSEINGLTCGGVGRGTTIENVQISYSGDDAFEFFGGTVNCKNLIAYKTWDDDFDTDFGYRGQVQFAVALRDPAIADQSGSNGFESDNDGQGTANTPITQPVFSNVTIVGPYVNNATTINSNYRRALHIRRNSKCSVYNSVFMGYPTGLFVDGSASQTNASNNDLRFQNNVLASMADSLAATSAANPNNINGGFNISSWFENASYNNGLTNNWSDLMYANLALNTPDFHLLDGSPLMNGASFADSYVSGSFFTPVNYRGAFGSEDWTSCWAEWDPQNEAYNAAINNVVTAQIIALGNTTVCPGGTVTLMASSNTINASYAWSTSENAEEITVAAPAQVTLQVIGNNGCSAELQSIELSVFDAPSVSISANGPTSFCTGSSVELVSSQNSGNLWSNDSSGNSIVVTESGTYSLSYTDGNGCEATSNTIEVNVSDSPAPTISTSGSTTFCDGSSVTLSASNSDSYQWYFNGQELAGETAQTLSAESAGAYYVNVTNADQCDGTGNSSNIYVVVNPQPEASFDFDAANGSYVYEFNNNSINAQSYLWNFGDGNTSTQANPTYTFTTPGTHTVTLTAVNGDCSDVFSITISNVSVEEVTLVNAIALYPNPTTSASNLVVELQNSEDVLVTVFDITGKVVYTENRMNATGRQVVELPGNEMSTGIYFVQVKVGTSSDMIKWIVRK